MKLLYPVENFVFDTPTELQNAFSDKIKTSGDIAAFEWLESTAEVNEYSHPQTLNFSWEIDEEVSVFEISKYEDFRTSHIIKTNKKFCEIGNFEVGQKYFWRVNGCLPRSFTTLNNFTRFIKIDGVKNVRDLGGNKIKQGVLYRGSELNGEYDITETGKKTFLEELSIHTELDLRGEVTGRFDKCVFGSEFNYKFIPYCAYSQVFEEKAKKDICDIMQLFADEKNYPIYFHCHAGADRTGMIALFLRALVGEDEESMYLDYALTTLSCEHPYSNADLPESFVARTTNAGNFIEFVEYLEKYAPNKSLSEKIKAFLFDCGVTTECMEKIVSIIKK